jgi:hypothetical protein
MLSAYMVMGGICACWVNSFQAISIIRGARYGVFTSKKHALNTLKMAPFLTAFKLWSHIWELKRGPFLRGHISLKNRT